jgi:hypothetical protein
MMGIWQLITFIQKIIAAVVSLKVCIISFSFILSKDRILKAFRQKKRQNVTEEAARTLGKQRCIFVN